MNPRKDHYSFLGIPMDAPPDQIAVAWDRMQRQADAIEATSPGQAQAIREKLRRVQEDLLSGATRREGYNRWLISTQGPGPHEPTVVQPLDVPPPPPQYTTQQPQYTTVLPQETAAPAAPRATSNARWLLPLAAVLALLLGVGIALAATRVLGNGANSAAVATTTSKPTATTQPTVRPTSPSPTMPTIAPASSPTVAVPTVSPPTAAPPTVAPAADPLTVDPARINANGYTATDGHAETSNGGGGTLYAWKAVCSGSADGYCQKVFFFDGTRYLGTDTLNSSMQIISVDAAGPATIAVKYANYLPNDPNCCPSGTPVTITYRWTGGRLVPSGTPPGHSP